MTSAPAINLRERCECGDTRFDHGRSGICITCCHPNRKGEPVCKAFAGTGQLADYAGQQRPAGWEWPA